MPILPDQFDSTPSIRLLREAAQGLIGFDRRLMRALLARPEETLDALEEFLESSREDDLLDITEQAFDLYRALGSARALPFYLRLLEQREPGEIPDELIEAIAAHGEAAVEPLLKLRSKLEEGDAHGADVVFVLAALGVSDGRIAALLRETLAKDPYEGALCIGLSGDPALKPDVEAALKALPESAVEERKVLAECLESLGRESQEDRQQDADILGQYPEEALPMFEQIKPQQVLEFLEVEDARYRAEAAGSFLDEEYGGEVRARLMEAAQSDPAPEVRGAAFRSLGERVEEPEVRALMLERLKEVSDPKELCGLLVGLAGATQLAEVHAAVLAAYQREELRAAAVEAMWRSLDPRFAPNFAEALESADPEVKRHGVQGVGALRLAPLASRLVPLFNDEDLREDALFAYAMAAPGKTNKKGVEKLFSEIEEKAGGLTGSEEETVALALDRRLEMEGHKPVFFHEEPAQAKPGKVGRNDPCPCGSGKKHKKCCGA
jgi:hypothetical protein